MSDKPIETRGELALPDRGPANLLPEVFRETVTPVYCSLNPQSIEDKALVLSALQAAEFDYDSLPKKEFSIRHVIAHKVSRINQETGDKDEWTRIVLIDEENATVSFGSKGIKDSLAHIMGVFGLPPWYPPLPVRVVQKSCGTNRRLLLLEIDTGKMTLPDKKTK